ncbi:MAG: dienelactone hydrolase family protein [Candidatus Methylomirabilales bacterium]
MSGLFRKRPRTLGLIILLATCVPLWGALRVETSSVTYNSGTEKVKGYLARPAGAGPFPALVVIHEWWGLNEQIRGLADTLAGEGYVALAVDLYRGRVTKDPMEAHELMRGVPEDRAIRDLKAAVAYLRGRSDVRGERIGSIGWCMGGGYSLTLAINQPDLAACVVYYGRLATDKGLLNQIGAPVLGLFGEQDRGIPPVAVRAFDRAMKSLGKQTEIHIYPGAGHAFANPTRPSYREAAAADAWKRTLAFFSKLLKHP